MEIPHNFSSLLRNNKVRRAAVYNHIPSNTAETARRKEARRKGFNKGGIGFLNVKMTMVYAIKLYIFGFFMPLYAE